MANEEHLRILKEGVEAWNRWRKEISAVVPPTSSELRATLDEIDASGSELHRTT